MAINIDMTGKRAIVTGGAQGIGLQTAEFIAEAGGSVLLADLNLEAAEKSAADLVAKGYKAVAAGVDVRDPDQCQAAVDKAVAELGGVDVLVNNAAAWSVNWFKKLTIDDWNLDVGVTLIGTMNMCKAALDPMSEAGGGAIVNLISDAGRVGEPSLTSYSAAKAGVVGFTKALAKEAARNGIRVNGVSPGTTHTPGGDETLNKWGGEEKILSMYPLGRLGEASDQAYAILFLASPLSTWITGQILSVNGGYSMVD